MGPFTRGLVDSRRVRKSVDSSYSYRRVRKSVDVILDE